MSNADRPDRLPKSVYVRRRIAVLAGLVAVILALVMIIAGPSTVAGWFGAGSDSKGNAGSSDNNKPNTSDSNNDDTHNLDSDGAEGDQGEAEPAVRTCLPSQLAVEAVTDSVEYFAGEYPKLSLRVTNHGAECDADLGTATMKFTVKSGNELYWNSLDCQVEGSKNLVRLAAGQTLETEAIVWDRTRSSPDTCDDEREEVPAFGDSFHLTTEIAGVESPRTKQFLLYQ